MSDSKISIKGFIVAVLNEGTINQNILETHNIITNDGDLFYAQKSCGEIPTYSFTNLVLGTDTVTPSKTDTYDIMTPISNTNKSISSGYPKTNDSDTDNTGKAVDSVTYKYSYTATDFNATGITSGCITIASPTTGSKILCRFKFASSFDKTANDTLTIYVNHNFLGA